jgi:hypothetical protein
MWKLHNKMTPVGLFISTKKYLPPDLRFLWQNIQIGFYEILYVLDITAIRNQSTMSQASLISDLQRHFGHHSGQENHGGPDIMYTVHHGHHNHQRYSIHHGHHGQHEYHSIKDITEYYRHHQYRSRPGLHAHLRADIIDIPFIMNSSWLVFMFRSDLIHNTAGSASNRFSRTQEDKE